MHPITQDVTQNTDTQAPDHNLPQYGAKLLYF